MWLILLSSSGSERDTEFRKKEEKERYFLNKEAHKFLVRINISVNRV